jgi:hypothetical protein
MIVVAAAGLLFVEGYSLQKNRRAALLSIYSSTATLLLSPESCIAPANEDNTQQQSASSPSLLAAGAKFQRYSQIRFTAALDPQASFGTRALYNACLLIVSWLEVLLIIDTWKGRVVFLKACMARDEIDVSSYGKC